MMAYHVESWSEQAREMSDIVIHNVNSGAWCSRNRIMPRLWPLLRTN